jgi:hypothetical protein
MLFVFVVLDLHRLYGYDMLFPNPNTKVYRHINVNVGVLFWHLVCIRIHKYISTIR